jgi:MerC mercury resistance protein
MAKFDADRAGAIASFLCAIHCASVGLLVSVLPLIGLSFLHDPRVEVGFYSTAILLGIWATVRGWKLHKSLWPGVLFGAGLSVVGFGHWMAGNRPEGSALETVGHLLSACGGLTLVAFHVLNARLTKSHHCSCKACSDHVAEEPGHAVVVTADRQEVKSA